MARTVPAPPLSVVECLWEVLVWGFGVLFLSCVCVSVSGVLFSVGVCVCVTCSSFYTAFIYTLPFPTEQYPPQVSETVHYLHHSHRLIHTASFTPRYSHRHIHTISFNPPHSHCLIHTMHRQTAQVAKAKLPLHVTTPCTHLPTPGIWHASESRFQVRFPEIFFIANQRVDSYPRWFSFFLSC